jgi:hypothetical protein
MTAELIAAAVADQGEVYSAQFPPVATTTANVAYTGTTNAPLGGVPNVAVPVMYNLPLSETTMALLSPGYYSGQARDGVYVPLRHSGPSNVPFAYPRDSIPNFTNYDPTPGTNGWIFQNVTRQSSQFQVTTSNQSITSTLPYITRPAASGSVNGEPSYGADTAFSNMNIGVTIFRGLAGASGGGFGASIKIKVCAGLELIPMTVSPGQVYARPPLSYDPKALEAYYALVVELGDSYPAAYNSFSEIFDKIGSVAKSLWPGVRAFGDAMTRPVVSVGMAQPPALKPSAPPSARPLAYHAPREAPRSRAPSVAQPRTRSVSVREPEHHRKKKHHPNVPPSRNAKVNH